MNEWKGEGGRVGALVIHSWNEREGDEVKWRGVEFDGCRIRNSRSRADPPPSTPHTDKPH